MKKKLKKNVKDKLIFEKNLFWKNLIQNKK